MPRRPENRLDVSWKRRWEMPDLSVLEAADSFGEAMDLLDAHSVPGSGLLRPLLNSAALALELYLKALSSNLVFSADESMPEISIVHSDPREYSHRPSVLLGKIQKDVQEQLAEAFRAQIGGDLKVTLAKYDDLWQSARYSFSRDARLAGIRIEPLIQLVHFMASFVHAMPRREFIQWDESEV